MRFNYLKGLIAQRRIGAKLFSSYAKTRHNVEKNSVLCLGTTYCYFLLHIELMKFVDMNINTAIKNINAAIHKRKVLELFFQTDDGNRMYFTVAPVCLHEYEGKLYCRWTRVILPTPLKLQGLRRWMILGNLQSFRRI